MRIVRVGSLVVLAALAGPGCSAAVNLEGHTSSPWEVGPSVRLTYPVYSRDKLSLHPMGSYTYFTYDGGNESRFELGGQARYAVSPAFWFGGELAYAFLRDSFGDDTENYSGPSIAAIFGVPIGTGRWNPQVVGGAGLSSYGSGGSAGKNVRLGVSITP